MSVEVLILVENYHYAEYLEQLFNWNELGLDIVGVEYNGALALEQFRFSKPGIVILDTVVPIIGVDRFIQLMQGYASNFVVILLDETGEFTLNHMQNIYRCLKKSSLDAALLTDTLRNAVSLLNKGSQSPPADGGRERSKRLSAVLGDGDFGQERLYQLRNDIGLQLSSSLHILLPRSSAPMESIPEALIADLLRVLQKYGSGEVIVMKDGVLCILINEILSSQDISAESRYDQLLGDLRWTLGKVFRAHITFCLCHVDQLGDLTAKYRLVRQIYDQGYFMREANLLKPGSFPKPNVQKAQKAAENALAELANAINAHSSRTFEKTIQETYLVQLKQFMSLPAVTQLRFKLELLYETFAMLYPGVQSDRAHTVFLSEYQTIEDEYETIRSLFAEAFQQSDALQTGMNPLVFQAVVQIINHFQEPISLSSIANRISVAPTYLSHLFSSQMNVNFSNYLTDVRIRKAKRLMRDGFQKISEIACLSGFSDYRYFSQIFKKATGLTPTEYRLQPEAGETGSSIAD